MDSSLQVLFEDNHCLVVAKPAPLLTQGPPGVPNLEAMAKDYLRNKYGKKGNVYLGVPHRLDRPVSGVIAFARSTKAAQRLAEQFRERTIKKVYWGVVEGSLEPSEGLWENWLRKQREQARSEPAEPNAEGAKRAVLRYRVLQSCEGGSLMEFLPETGRMHQIRLQASLHGVPIRGDVIYGSNLPFGPAAEQPRDRVIALHARSLTFLHPIRFEPIEIVAPLPEIWHSLGISVDSPE